MLQQTELHTQVVEDRFFSKSFWLRIGIFCFVCLMLATTFVLAYASVVNNPDPDFPVGSEVVIEQGMTIRDVSDAFEKKSLVRSSLFLYLTLIGDYKGGYVQAGAYRFDEPLSTSDIARAITLGEYLVPEIKVTFPEGFRASNILSFLPDGFSSSDVSVALPYEGYLFPDTYYIPRDMTFTDLIEHMRKTFEIRIEPYRDSILASGLSEKEVVTLASIIEREAKDVESMGMVAGILRNRLDAGMPLQVDATFDYLLGKESSELTLDDLAIDSPYNTYDRIGLPPTPISNPGLAAIEAVLYPTQTDYFYYLTGSDGTFHYAKTFDEHRLNKARYLR